MSRTVIWGVAATVTLGTFLGCSREQAGLRAAVDDVPDILHVAGFRELSEVETRGPLFRVRGVEIETSALWVLDAGNHRLLRVPAEGPTRVIGREGSGPGEFRAPYALSRSPDGGIVVWDRGLGRLTVIDSSEVEATANVPVGAGGLTPWEAYLLLGRQAVLFNTRLSARGGSAARRGALILYDRSWEALDTLRTFPLSGALTLRVPTPGGFRFSVFDSFADTYPHTDATAACGGVLAVSSGTRDFSVVFFDARGMEVGRIQSGIEGPEVGMDEWEAYLERWDPDDRRLLREKYPPPDRFAPVQDLVTASSGHLWVRLTPVERTEDAVVWRVWKFSAGLGLRSGRLEGVEPADIRLPEELTPMDATRDTVWGVYRHPLGTQTIRGYALSSRLEPSTCLQQTDESANP